MVVGVDECADDLRGIVDTVGEEFTEQRRGGCGADRADDRAADLQSKKPSRSGGVTTVLLEERDCPLYLLIHPWRPLGIESILPSCACYRTLEEPATALAIILSGSE